MSGNADSDWTPSEGVAVEFNAPDIELHEGRLAYQSGDKKSWFIKCEGGRLYEVKDECWWPKGRLVLPNGRLLVPKPEAAVILLPKAKRVRVQITQDGHPDKGEMGTIWGSALGNWRIKLDNHTWAAADVPSSGVKPLEEWEEHKVDPEAAIAYADLLVNTREPSRTVERPQKGA